MVFGLLHVLKGEEKDTLSLSGVNLENYKILLKNSNKIKKGDIVLNAGLTYEILPELREGRFSSFLKDIYGVYINEKFDRDGDLYALYNTAVQFTGKKTGVERALSIADSVYRQLFYRMNEYADGASVKMGLMTSYDFSYMERNHSRKGKAFSLDSAISDGPFLCHEFSIVLSLILEKEKKNTGLAPFYTMGLVKNKGETAEHSWLELEDKKGNRFLLDKISGVAEYLPSSATECFISSSGIKYARDNGAFILRKLKISRNT